MQSPATGSQWRHYKSTGGNNHTYEVVGIAKHSETEELLVIYKPLFNAESTRLGEATFAVRPLSMRYETIVWHGKELPRFTEIS